MNVILRVMLEGVVLAVTIFLSWEDKEYVELNDRIAFIISKFRTYIKGYHNYAAGKANEYQAKRYKYTTLKYFHKELGIMGG